MQISLHKRLLGWLVHALTASGAFIGILCLNAIHEQRLIAACWLMGAAIFIDAIDGALARLVKVKVTIPQIDGALLDNIVDFINYAIIPAFFLLTTTLMPSQGRLLGVAAIVFSSAYQFSQIDAKTSDHFFKGFPSYWNITVFYLFFWQMSTIINLAIVLLLAILSFIPIKYVYPSRLDYLSHNTYLQFAMLAATIIWGIATAGLLWVYPASNSILVSISIGYLLLYGAISLYRTWFPLKPQSTIMADQIDKPRKSHDNVTSAESNFSPKNLLQ